jgi:hypothetical protein
MSPWRQLAAGSILTHRGSSVIDSARPGTFDTLAKLVGTTGTRRRVLGALIGALVSLETGTRYRLGVDAISLPALDGTILLHDPEIGVPATLPDLSVDVETVWWANHWANPASSQYRPPSAIPTHPRVVTVAAGDNLQAKIDAAPDYTTFVLDHTGTFARCRIIERRRLHFISSSVNNPAQRPTCRGFDIFGSRYAVNYNPIVEDGITYPGFQPMVAGSGGTAAEIKASQDAWFNPANDFIFRDIDFISDGSLVYYRKWNVFGTVWNSNHWEENTAIGMRCVRDVLIERCAVSGYKSGFDQSTGPPNDPVETSPPAGRRSRRGVLGQQRHHQRRHPRLRHYPGHQRRRLRLSQRGLFGRGARSGH